MKKIREMYDFSITIVLNIKLVKLLIIVVFLTTEVQSQNRFGIIIGTKV